jgi:hypothetical protein
LVAEKKRYSERQHETVSYDSYVSKDINYKILDHIKFYIDEDLTPYYTCDNLLSALYLFLIRRYKKKITSAKCKFCGKFFVVNNGRETCNDNCRNAFSRKKRKIEKLKNAGMTEEQINKFW